MDTDQLAMTPNDSQGSERGQSVVEYLLLLGVLMTIAISVLTSDYFQSLLGPESEVFRRMRETMEYTYRHGRFGVGGNASYGGNHDTYYDGSNTRFFTPTEGYPE